MESAGEGVVLRSAAVEILIVEDSPTQALQLRHMLSRQGYAVVIARNGREALARLRTRRPTFVISDVVMPEMDGYELCQRVKADSAFRSLPVILLTSLSDPKDIIRGLECGADNFITKPYQERYLLDRIQYILLNQELRRDAAPSFELDVVFGGRRYTLTSERMQIVDLMLSSFESAVQKNQELMQRNLELREALATIRSLEANYRSLLESNAEGMVVVDRDGVVRYANPAAEALFGRPAGELVGGPCRLGVPVVPGEVREVTLERPGAAEAVVEMRVVATTWEGQRAHLASLRDVTELVRIRERLRFLSTRDELTGLLNRRGFLTVAEQSLSLAQRERRSAFLLFADLDGLKWINDNLGHRDGDAAIAEAATLLRETFRASDVLGRVGGDEFVVLAFASGEESAEAAVARLQAGSAARNALPGRRYRLSLSLGVTQYDPERPGSIDDLMRQADELMYEQKRARRRGRDVDMSP